MTLAMFFLVLPNQTCHDDSPQHDDNPHFDDTSQHDDNLEFSLL